MPDAEGKTRRKGVHMETLKQQLELNLSFLIAKLTGQANLRSLVQQYTSLLPAEERSSKEFALLLKLTRALHSISDEYVDVKQAILTSIKHRQALLASPPPKIIHFIWLGPLGDIQLDYIRQWVKTCPDYQINLWYDKHALLSRELFLRIKYIADAAAAYHVSAPGVVFDSYLANKIIEIQNKSHDAVKQEMSRGNNFDTSAKKFMVFQCGANQQTLNTMKAEFQTTYTTAKTYLQRGLERKINFQLREISDGLLFHQHPYLYACYLQELSLRQNLAAATGIVRLLIAWREGGYCLDADVLPSFSPVDPLPQGPLPGVSQTTSDIITSTLVLEELTQRGEFPARKGRMHKYVGSRNIMDKYPKKEVIQSLRAVIKKSMDAESFFTSPDGGVIANETGMLYYQSAHGNDSFAMDTIKAMVSQRNAKLVSLLLEKVENMYRFIADHNIDGLHPQQPVPVTLSQQMKADLIRHDFIPVETPDGGGSKHIVGYRLDNIATERKMATVYLSGPEMYEMSSRAFFKSDFPLHDPGDIFFWVKSKMGLMFENVTVSTEEGVLSTWIDSAMMEYRDVFTLSARDNAQIILQLEQDPVSHKMASFLYNQHATVTKWVNYDATTDALRVVQETRAFSEDGRKRVIVVGHGKPGEASMGDLLADKVAALISRVVPEQRPVKRLSLVGCNIGNALLSPDGVLPVGFTFSLLTALTALNREVAETTIEQGLVTVDVMGRKWTGGMNPHTNQIEWRHQKELNTFLIKKISQVYLYRKIDPEDVMLDKASLLPSYDPGRFGVAHTILNAQFHPHYFHLPAFENRDQTTEGFAREGLKRMLDRLVTASKEGALLLAADSVALLMGLSSENPYEMVIVDKDIHRLHTVQQALRRAVTVPVVTPSEALSSGPTYQEWVNSLMLVDQQLALFHQLVPMTGNMNSEQAFEQLKKRVKENKFSFYHLDLTTPDAAENIQAGQSGSAGFTGFYLGRLKAYYGTIADHSLANKNIVGKTLARLEANVKTLKYVLSTGERMSENKRSPWVFHCADVDETEAYRPHRVDTLDLVASYTAEQYLHNLTVRRSDINSAAEAALLAKELNRALSQLSDIDDVMLPVFRAITFEVDRMAWKLPFMNPRHPGQEAVMVETRSDVFIRMYRFLNARSSSVRSALPDLTKKNFIVPDEAAPVHGLNAAFAIQTLLLWTKQPSALPTARQLSASTAIELHFYLNILLEGQALLSDLLQAGSLFRQVLTELQMFMKGGFGQFEKNFNRLMSGVHSAGMVLNGAALGLDVYELVSASSEDHRSRAVFQLTLDASLFSVVSASVVTGMVGMETLSASLSSLGTPLTGLSIGGLALYNATEEIHQKTKYCGNFLNILCDGLHKGYEIHTDPQGKRCLIPPVLAAIDYIELSPHGYVVFAPQRYQRYEAVAGSVLSWMFFGKRPVKGAGAYGDYRQTLRYPPSLPLPDNRIDTIILPASPRGGTNFAYGVEVFANSSNIDYNPDKYPEYRCARSLERRDPGFLFSYHTVLDHAMHTIIPFYEKTTVRITIVSGNKTLIFPWASEDKNTIETEAKNNRAIADFLSTKYGYLDYVVQAAPGSKQTLVLPGIVSLRLTIGHIRRA